VRTGGSGIPGFIPQIVLELKHLKAKPQAIVPADTDAGILQVHIGAQLPVALPELNKPGLVVGIIAGFYFITASPHIRGNGSDGLTELIWRIHGHLAA
jgi:hypothetical protein